MNVKLLIIIASLVIYVAGIVILGLTAGWLPVLGVFLMQWANNVSLKDR